MTRRSFLMQSVSLAILAGVGSLLPRSHPPITAGAGPPTRSSS